MAVDHSWQAVFNPGASDVFPPHRAFIHAPSFLAGYAPVNYTAQLPLAFEN